ncbi:acyl-CoA synthetase (NDP forming) [Bradyrhizobium sp. AZCC 1588]
MADRAAADGLALPALAEQSVAALREVLPSFASVANPLDVTASLFSDADLLRVALETIARDPSVDMIALALAAASGKMAVTLAREIVRISAEFDIPIFVAWNADATSNRDAYAILDDAGIPRYASPVRCARGIGALWAFTCARQRLARTKGEQSEQIPSTSQMLILAGRETDLSEFESKQFLTQYGIPSTREILSQNVDEAVRGAQSIGFPVVLKIQSSDIPHKTEAGGVRIGLRDDRAVHDAFEAIIANARAYAPNAAIQGVVVQEMVTDGVELILGINNDPLFGPAIMVGLGGIFAEVMKDVSFRLAPITRSDAEDMLRELRGFALLDGARNRPKADVVAVVDTLMRLSALAVSRVDDLAELDINPLAVLPAGRGVRALDALVKPRAVSSV